MIVVTNRRLYDNLRYGSRSLRFPRRLRDLKARASQQQLKADFEAYLEGLADPPDARPLAGGMTLIPTLKARLAQPSHLVDISGLEELRGYIGPGKTVGFIGSSGVGMSWLSNRLLGREAQAVGGLRDDERGLVISISTDDVLFAVGSAVSQSITTLGGSRLLLDS